MMESSPSISSTSDSVPLIEEGRPVSLKGEAASAFGSKNITYWGSICLLVNNIMGPAMVTIPLVYHLGGFLSTTSVLLLTFVVGSFSATMLCEAMQRIPGNHDFSLRYEFATTMGHYYGKKAEIMGQILVNGCLMASAMASIIVAAQVMDDFLAFAFGHTYGVHIVPPYKFISVDFQLSKYFDCETYVLSLGYLLCAAVCIPFGYFNLDDNMYFQWFSFALLVGTVLEFLIAFFCMPLHLGYVQMLGRGLYGQSLVLGVVSFSWAYIITAIAFANTGDSANILNVRIVTSLVMTNESKEELHGWFRIFTAVFVYLYNIGTIIPGIPVYSILIRYNLVSGKLLNPFLSNIVAVVFPWAFSCFFYHGQLFSAFVNWSSLLLQGFVNFVIPCALYYKALTMYPAPPTPDLTPTSEGPIMNSGSNRSIQVTCDHDKSETCKEVDVVEAVKSWMQIPPKKMAVIFAIFFTFISVFTIVMNVYYAIVPPPIPQNASNCTVPKNLTELA